MRRQPRKARPLSRCQRTQCWTSHAGRGMPMGRGCNMPRQACCVDTIQQVALHESGPLRCESNNSLPGRLSLLQERTCPGTNEAQQPDPYRRQQRSRRAMGHVCRSRALSQIWARLQCDQLVSSVADLSAECGPARYAWCGEAAENLSHENARPSVRVRLCE
jgi:hypothetical protein